ncbi:HAMP domain-containing protein [Sphingomonas cavernae]|uniref:histidine kinase n=2 Tax=Sphingomonas cavernae TaxID=2320861 RepID=A0A418W840_9SPHN|nr:HAMP domain-containing protein [Sphingomonas cavernae]
MAIALLVAQAINFALALRERERLVLTQVSAPTIARLIDAVERDRAGQPVERRFHHLPAWRGIRLNQQSVIGPNMRPRKDIADRARAAFAELEIPVLRIEAAEGDIHRGDRLQRMTQARRAVIGDDRGPRPTLVVTAQVAPGRWISATAKLPYRDNRFIFWLIAQTLILYAVMLVPVLWIGRRIARPLQQLTGAVESFRSAEGGTAVPESGPGDVRRLIAAYNGMRTRIAGMLDEKDRMLGAIGHDLRTPLASLRLRVEGIDDEGERDRAAGTIEEMNRTLDDILSLARLGRPSEAETRVDLGALLDSVVDDFQALGADVSLAEAPRTTVTIRPTLITRAVRNLIDNAVKYGGRAVVAVGSEDGGVVTTIDDDGPGIPEDRIEAMFQPFTRLEESRSRETGGTGLGLALARAIALQHGGRLTLANREGGGLRARLWLPV